MDSSVETSESFRILKTKKKFMNYVNIKIKNNNLREY